MLFLHKDGDFVPYTPRRKENLHENLHGLQKEELREGLELTIRKEVKIWTLCPVLIWFPTVRSAYSSTNRRLCWFSPQLHDFAKLNENIFYVYNDIEYFKDEPQKISIACEEDIHVTEEVYKRPMFTMPAYRLFTQSLYWPFSAAMLDYVRLLRVDHRSDYKWCLVVQKPAALSPETGQRFTCCSILLAARSGPPPGLLSCSRVRDGYHSRWRTSNV